ncbi:MAG: DNA translocase FtsK [Mediterranea sp.]|nr:DNA translocase FtsK [Mediterranea sp.]
MAKKNNTKEPQKETQEKSEVQTRKPSFFSKVRLAMRNETFHFITGLMLVIFSIYLLLAFISFFLTGAADQSVLDHATAEQLASVNNGVKNYTGSRGAQVASFFINDCFGLASFFIVVFLVVAGLKLMKVRVVRLWKWFMACSLLLIWFSIFFGFAFAAQTENSFFYLGGRHGANVSRWIESQVGVPGVWLLLLATALCFFIYLSARTIDVLRKFFALNYLKRKPKAKQEPNEGDTPEEFTTSWTGREAGSAAAVAAEAADAADAAADQAEERNRKTAQAAEDKARQSVDDAWAEAAAQQAAAQAAQGQSQESTMDAVSGAEGEEASVTLDLGGGAAAGDTVRERKRADDEVEIQIERAEPDPLVDLAKPGQPTEEENEPGFDVEAGGEEEDEFVAQNLEPYNPRLDLENYRFPTLDLMKHYDNDAPTINMEEQNANKEKIITTLRSFGIEIRSIKATVGPTVTLYEITPGDGVRIARIRNLEDDIALCLKALGVRIIAPIPGKGTIGIEVPNMSPQIVSGQSIIGSRKFQESTYELPIALGKTITNEVFMVDLAKMPHILVAGATGQGKSVGLNAIITSLLYKKHPAELKFVLVDPKKVEFSIYSVIENHFLAKLPDQGEPVITDVTKVVQTLNSICVEMDTRYDLLKAAHVRNVKEYNEKFIARKLNPEKGHKYMPYIVVVIDEFGDLIMTAGKDVELPIARIAQLARAVGIHMIIATQRPTTNIITGTIKANFPARIAFRVMQMIDSRTILDRPGANQLIGRGDMLFSQGGDPVRVQCAFIDTPEVADITNYIARQQGYTSAFLLPEYVDPNSDGGDMGDVDMGHLDPLFEDAARLVVVHQQGSTSLIQRKFSIGYNRAGRIMDQLEKAGIVGAAQGSKPREVCCVDETDLEMRLNNLL